MSLWEEARDMTQKGASLRWALLHLVEQDRFFGWEKKEALALLAAYKRVKK